MRWLTLILLLAGRVAAWGAARYHYAGTLGTMPIQMGLEINGQAVLGTYRYERAGRTLWIDGTVDGTQVVLREGLENRNRTNYALETNAGLLTGAFAENQRTFTGTWESNDGTRTFPFTVNAIAGYQTTEAKAKLPTGETATFSATWPVFYKQSPLLTALQGKLNAEVVASREAFLAKAKDPEQEANLTESHEYEIVYLSDNMVSLLITERRKTVGEEEATITKQGISYRYSRKTATPFILNDIVSPKADPDALGNLLLKDLIRQGAEWPPEHIAPEDIPSFYLTPTAITFVFQRDDIGPGTAGEYYVYLPFTALKSIINPNGALKPWLK